MRAAIAISVLLALGACTREPESAPTVEWFRAHEKERQAVVQECANDPGQLGTTPRCVNALDAEGRESAGSLRDLPPMNLGKPDAH